MGVDAARSISTESCFLSSPGGASMKVSKRSWLTGRRVQGPVFDVSWASSCVNVKKKKKGPDEVER